METVHVMRCVGGQMACSSSRRRTDVLEPPALYPACISGSVCVDAKHRAADAGSAAVGLRLAAGCRPGAVRRRILRVALLASSRPLAVPSRSLRTPPVQQVSSGLASPRFRSIYANYPFKPHSACTGAVFAISAAVVRHKANNSLG